MSSTPSPSADAACTIIPRRRRLEPPNPRPPSPTDPIARQRPSAVAGRRANPSKCEELRIGRCRRNRRWGRVGAGRGDAKVALAPPEIRCAPPPPYHCGTSLPQFSLPTPPIWDGDAEYGRECWPKLVLQGVGSRVGVALAKYWSHGGRGIGRARGLRSRTVPRAREDRVISYIGSSWHASTTGRWHHRSPLAACVVEGWQVGDTKL